MARKTLDQLNDELPQVALTEGGDEIPNPTPIEIPAGMKIPETTEERFQRMIRHSMSEFAARNDAETFDEADDFEVDDDGDPSSPYEEVFDPVLGRGITPQEFHTREAVIRDRYTRAQKKYWQDIDRLDAMRQNRRRKAQDEPQPRGAGGPPPASTPPVQPSKGENGGT